MDYVEQINNLTIKRNKLCETYYKCRVAYGTAKADLDIVYASKIKDIQMYKKNAGYETGLLFLISINPELKETYQLMIINFNKFKALQRLIDALESEIMTLQSIMKYNIKNDGGY